MDKYFLYHMVPVDMQGNILYPLNSLKEINPKLFEAKSAKYTGREEQMKWRIPTLKADWNDVLHFTAVPPKQLMHALVEAGMQKILLKCYQIDPESLDPEKVTVYLYSKPIREEGLNAADFVKFDVQDLQKYSVIPEETKRNYEKSCREGKRPLAFEGIPHILYKGTIDVTRLPVATA